MLQRTLTFGCRRAKGSVFTRSQTRHGSSLPQAGFLLRNPSTQESSKMIEDLHTTGITSVQILNEESRSHLAEVAKSLPYRDVDAYAGPHKVEQDFKFFDKDHVLENGHPFMLLKARYEAWVNSLFLTLDPRSFTTPFSINEITVNKYQPQSRGIGAHRDHARYLNLVSIFVLEGYENIAASSLTNALFYTAATANSSLVLIETRGKFFEDDLRTVHLLTITVSDSREIVAPPGSVTLMRAPGLFNFTINDRPYHYLSEVISTRISLIMRQDSKYGAKYEK